MTLVGTRWAEFAASLALPEEGRRKDLRLAFYSGALASLTSLEDETTDKGKGIVDALYDEILGVMHGVIAESLEVLTPNFGRDAEDGGVGLLVVVNERYIIVLKGEVRLGLTLPEARELQRVLGELIDALAGGVDGALPSPIYGSA